MLRVTNETLGAKIGKIFHFCWNPKYTLTKSALYTKAGQFRPSPASDDTNTYAHFLSAIEGWCVYWWCSLVKAYLSEDFSSFIETLHYETLNMPYTKQKQKNRKTLLPCVTLDTAQTVNNHTKTRTVTRTHCLSTRALVSFVSFRYSIEEERAPKQRDRRRRKRSRARINQNNAFGRWRLCTKETTNEQSSFVALASVTRCTRSSTRRDSEHE